MLKKLSLQLFGDGDPNPDPKPNPDPNSNNGSGEKTFTQEEMDKIVKERLAREQAKLNSEKEAQIKEMQEKIERMAQEAKFKDLSEEQRKAEEQKLAIEKIEKEKAQLEAQVKVYERQARISEVMTEYGKDCKVGNIAFGKVAYLIANIDDETERLTAYNAMKEFAQSIEADIRKDVLKQTPPNSGNGGPSLDGNPFANNNLTEMMSVIKNNPEEAKRLAKEAGVYDKFFK